MKNARIREKSRKKKKLEDGLNEPIPQINTDSSQTPFFQLMNLELLDNIMQDMMVKLMDFYMVWKRYKK
ncbi:hypothetical protein RhiirC2_757655 [Rhizophagus irregularis]|uniref:Uncharacterized protein n=1 Tax=Rhizophagus irregularis TaxID=588596 RepID=A0A2N1MQB6_9GLOM|nr:hypothetical protein RhiirC2_757655 [Rhizophagus irregularis]